MVHKILFWSGFGVAVRAWQLGLEMRPILGRESLWVYGLFGGIGGSFGYWLKGVDEDQEKELGDRKAKLLAKRERRVLREMEARAKLES